MRRTGVLLALTLLALLTASAADGASPVLYRTTGSDNHLLAYGLAPTGALFPIAGSPLALSGSPQGVALTPDGRFLYVALAGTSQIAAFGVNAEGALSALPGSPFATGAAALGLAVSPDGRSLYEASGGGNAVYRQAIGIDGSLSAPGAPTSTGASSFSGMVAITPDGRRLYVSTFNLGSVAGFAVAADGSLSPLPGSPYPAPTGGLGISIAPDGAHLYVASTFSSAVYAASIGANGALTALTGSPFPSGPGTRGIAIAADGQRLYTTNTAIGGGQGTWGYNVAADGSLTAGTPFSPPAQSAIAMAPDSRHLYVAAAFSGATNGLNVGAAGELTLVPGSPYSSTASGSDAYQMAISPDQPPVAAFAASPGAAGSLSVLDASASADPDGSIARYEWSFGDGSSASAGAVTTHTYAAPGTYRVTVTETDDEGCSTAFIFTGQTAMCNGSPVAQASHDIVVPEAKSSASPTPSAASPDKKPPTLKLSGKKKQTLGPTVSVGAACDEACTVTASGQVKTKQGKAADSFKLAPKSAHLAAGATGTLKLKLTKAMRKAASEALRAGGSASAALSITATDASGNSATARRAVHLSLAH
ncbi:MAG: beta-propeller fold lactonase family protein [Actinobacteria bacterium]|nr:beta-propeller fold lactonase family protein [Actinomycetota bacterium]